MSCGNPHEVDCATVLSRLYEVLDNEADEATCEMVRLHLAECAPCDSDAGLEKSVKALVARACGCEPVPDDLRRRVSLTIAAVQVDENFSMTQVQTVEWNATTDPDSL